MSTRHFLIALAAGLAALAIGVPLAGAGNTPVDDYWRDKTTVALPGTSTIVDDYWRDARLLASTMPASGDRIVDDYFRDVPRGVAAAPTSGDRVVDDYFRDVQAPPAPLVDDYFRDAPTVVATSGNAFDWTDFGIGAAVSGGVLLLLAGLGLGIRAGRSSVPGATKSTGMSA